MKSIMLLTLLGLAGNGLAQEIPTREANLDKLAEELFTTADNDVNYSELYEALVQLLAHPVDLNTVTRDRLRALMILSEEEINSFINYREEQGSLLTVYELQAIPNWSKATLDRVLSFVTVPDPKAKINTSILRRIAKEKNNYLVLRHERTLEPKKGYGSLTDSAHRYQGSPDKLYLRYRVSRMRDFSLGLTAEKDPGEPLVWSPASQLVGFDFLSWHAQLMDKGRLENLILGDFQCQFGQGLQLGSVYGLGKNSETITGIRRSNLGFLPYTSVSEILFLRGVAASWRVTRQIRVHAFASHKKRDGTIQQLPEEDPWVTSLSSSGLHRTPQEIRSQNQIGDTDAGMVLQFRNSRIDAGIIMHQKVFSQLLLPPPNPYNQFSMQGKHHQNAGFYFNMSWANVTLFTEAAQTLGNGAAVTAGLLGNLTHKLEMAWLYRKFAGNYYAHYANAFSESTSPQNEEGFYWGGKYTFNRRFGASAYMDIFQFPWLRYRIYRPSEGYEWLLRIDYTPSKTVSLFLQAREEAKTRNHPGEATLYRSDQGTKRNIWIHCDFMATQGLTFKTRIQGSQYEFIGETTRGLAFIQDITYSRHKWSLSLRYALFDTDDHDNRQYVYEKDVWLTASLPAYEGDGIRNYLLFQYTLTQKVDLWIRWARTRYLDRESIGTGTEQIEGNTRNDTKFQVRIRF